MSESSSEKGSPPVGEKHLGLLQKDWTEAEEARAKLKVDLVVMPLLMLGFFCLQLDRGNIGNAVTDNFREDIGISQNQFNVGQQLLSLGIVIGEIPANLVLYRWGPQKWLSLQVFLFGIVSIFQAWQNSYGAYLTTRLLLGLTESGYIPGALWAITTWYTRKETAKRTMIFFVGNLSAGALTNVISYGLLQMRGVAGRPGWFWIFVIMGLFTILTALLLLLFLPDSVANPAPFLLPKLRYFTDRELYILKYRVILDDPSKAYKSKHVTMPEFKSALSNWRLFPHLFITLFNNAPLNAFTAYTPTIISTFGYERLRSNALASVGYFILIPVSVAFSYLSDRLKWRASTVILALVINLGAMIMAREVATTDRRSLRFGSIIWVTSIGFTAHPLNIAWLALHCRNSSERAIWMALIIMAANCAGIIGAQLFRSDDSPYYRRGFLIIALFIAAGLLISILQAINYRWLAKKRPTESNSSEQDAVLDDVRTERE